MNGSTLITGDLEVKGTITGYATQAAVNLKANTADVYTKSQTDEKLAFKANVTALDNTAPWVYDTNLLFDAIHTDILRPKRPEAHNTPHIKVDTNLAIVGTCNVSYDLVVDGTNILKELVLRAPKANPNFHRNNNVQQFSCFW